ncbi:uridylate kinase [Methanoregula sp. UBA64]|jgi:5-(aminomethyl)-3-furanmethanol phosphate kinase|uniref:uridylate kinase n=1 Tax=Methanoregula sp. UBA64 TaxID=1915554 RepID=UPI0025D65577|nr:uridylate kinase [Methanoregula sp. UBA64]
MQEDRHGKKTGGLVVKVGGSLAPHIPAIVPVLQDSPRPLLVVPGGGLFADAVRTSACANNADAAHWMACAAMDQYGWLIAANGLVTTTQIAVPETTTVLLPYCALRRHDPLPHSWDVTSDTIAAWVAKTAGCDLLVLKSVDGIETGGNVAPCIDRAIATDTVDPCFIPFVLNHRIRTFVMNGSDAGRLAGWLEGKTVPGTRLGTTF